MSLIDDFDISMHSDALTDHVHSFPKSTKEIPLFSSENVFLHIPAQCSATSEEIPVKGVLKLVHRESQIRIQWFPTDISNTDLACLYSHDPSDDWEDLLHDLNSPDLPSRNGDKRAHSVDDNVMNGSPDKYHQSYPKAASPRKMKLASSDGDQFTSIEVKSETLRPNHTSPSKKISPGFVNIEATPVYSHGKRHNFGTSRATSAESPFHNPSQKSAHIFTINKPITQSGQTLDTSVVKLGDDPNIDSDAVYLEQTNVPDIKSVVVDFPIGILFSVKEVSAKYNGSAKSHPAIRFNLKGSKPTQNLYFHSGKQTMMRFYEELQKHILLYRNDDDPTLLIAEPEEFVGHKSSSQIDSRSFIQIASSKATDIINDNLPKIRAFFPFQKHPSPNTSPDKHQDRFTPAPVSATTIESRTNGETEVPAPFQTTSLPFIDRPNFDLLALLEGVKRKSRGIPLCRGDWELFCDRDGTVRDPSTIKSIIFNGGIEDDIRADLWPFLLGYYNYSQTDTEREQYMLEKENEYLVMRSQWKTMTPGQIERNKSFSKAKSIIAKDTIRTDREHPYFAGEGNPNLDILQDILLTHVMYDFDLGYIQGMSDILSPILIVLDKEIDSFWCFTHYLEKLRENFANTTEILKSKMNSFKDLLKFVDPPFCAFLRENEAYGFNIFFRWLLVDFKREFKFPDLYKLWEVLWTDHLTPHYNLFVALSMLLQMRHKIMEEDMSGSDFTPFDNIFKMVNDAAGDFDVDITLLLAEELFTKMLNCPNLPPEIIKFFPTYHSKHENKDFCRLDLDDDETNMELEELYFA